MAGPPVESAPPESHDGSLGGLVAKLAWAVHHELSPGDLAALRRMRHDDPSVPAFWRVTTAHLSEAMPPNGTVRLDAERRWATILSAMAILRGLLQPRLPLGKALAQSGFSELRFVRLLRARDEALLDTVRSAAQFLAAKGQSVDPLDLARLVLTRDRDLSEETRRRFAQDFYSNLDRQ